MFENHHTRNLTTQSLHLERDKCSSRRKVNECLRPDVEINYTHCNKKMTGSVIAYVGKSWKERKENFGGYKINRYNKFGD